MRSKINVYIGACALVGIALLVVAFRNVPQDIHASPAVDMFLKISGIPGESVDTRHRGEIDIDSFKWGMEQPRELRPGASRAGKVTPSDIIITKKVDKASPDLMLMCAQGKHAQEAVITVRRRETGDDYITLTFSDILCSSFTQQGSSGGEVNEQISLNFAKVEIEYKIQQGDGAGQKKGSFWDFVRQRGGIVEMSTPTPTPSPTPTTTSTPGA